MVFRPCADYDGGGNYVDCYPQNGGGHHFYESIKNELESFRLQSADGDFSAVADMLLNDDTSSIASKKRIDSMFKTPTSVVGDNEKRTSDDGGGDRVPSRRAKSLATNDDHYRHDDDDYFGYGYDAADTNNKNTVQEKIEKMFAEISSSELDTDLSMDTAAGAVGSNKYHVQYIGCDELSGKISSLEGLQQPVRNMYFSYRENQHHYVDNGTVDKRRDFSGLLEISAAGLTIRYRNELGDTVHRTNPFPSIAVWAALKYVCRRQSSSPKQITGTPISDGVPAVTSYEYAFLPLIADPDGSDKAPLFQDMDAGDRARLDAAGDHAPVFAVVTRKAGKRLECHGFACETENDALLMAANLYGALVEAMSSVMAVDSEKAKQKATPVPRRVIRQRNGFTSMSSTAGSSVAGGDIAPALPPPRPPRRNKKSVSSTGSSISGDRMSAIVADEPDVSCSDAKTFRMTVKQPPSLRRGVCNSSSAITTEVSTSVASKDEPNTKHKSDSGSGDILTRVAIPRSRSFLSSNGLACTKYSRRTAGCGIETDADRCRRRSNGSSVMGFSDMFNELRVQEGLNNMDDILNVIINAEGMSYNDLKPIYREFLLKLSMTLTKDELYQRTKAIMLEQKRKRNKRCPSTIVASAVAAVATASRGRRLNNKLRNALNLRAAKSRIGAALLPDFCKRKKRNPKVRKPRRCSCSANGSVIRPVVPKPERKNNQRRSAVGKRATGLKVKSRRNVSSSPVCSTTSDESEFFASAALRKRQHEVQHQQLYRKSKTRSSKTSGRGVGRLTTTTASESGCLHQASSGYFSCSECSAGATDDKCYCDGNGRQLTSMVSCSCDSDSCADSDKCYCGRQRRPRNIFDELKSRGFAASESSVSRADSPGTAWKKNELLMMLHERHDGCGPGGSSSAATAATGIGDSKCGIEPSKSLEYLKVSRRPSVDQHYSSVAKATVLDRMKVYSGGCDVSTAGSSSSSLSAATVYSSSSAIGAAHHINRRPQRRSGGSSGSDNFRAIDYTLFANNAGAAGRKTRGCGTRHSHNRAGADYCPPAVATAAVSMNRRSYSSEAVHLTGCRVYHHHQTKTTATRRHSVHDGGDDVLSSFFKSGIKNSLGYYP